MRRHQKYLFFIHPMLICQNDITILVLYIKQILENPINSEQKNNSLQIEKLEKPNNTTSKINKISKIKKKK